MENIMEHQMKLSVIMPVYNEVNTLKEVVEAVIATGRAYELLIVDDGSTDGTRELYPEIEKAHSSIRV
ncbi:MAG: glycosyltransferase involved in cell wall biosynthesis, partial [Candidatus Promineifilaceae bacterium]